MEEKIREIISVYIRTPAKEISPSSGIDRTALGSSILLHRMYARLAQDGILIENYSGIKNFGDLLGRVQGREQHAAVAINGFGENQHTVQNNLVVNQTKQTALGIDIQEIASLPRVDDFREDAFYTLNFSGKEIAYCILQQDPYSSFAGLFAAKEAIVKADNGYANRNFNNILIDHLPGGKPVHSEFEITVSHSGGLAVAAAIRIVSDQQGNMAIKPDSGGTANGRFGWRFWLTILSFLLSVIAIFIALNHQTG
jgi:phosphopantetheine--protein transferase-like protein